MDETIQVISGRTLIISFFITQMFQISRNALIRCGTISDFQLEADCKQEVIEAEWLLFINCIDKLHQVSIFREQGCIFITNWLKILSRLRIWLFLQASLSSAGLFFDVFYFKNLCLMQINIRFQCFFSLLFYRFIRQRQSCH